MNTYEDGYEAGRAGMSATVISESQDAWQYLTGWADGVRERRDEATQDVARMVGRLTGQAPQAVAQ